MHTSIALLRGINVGGHKKLKMTDLKLLFEELGFKEVHTYIQSGNVVFSSEEKEGLEEIISKEIKNRYGWEVPVFVKTVAEVKQILADCPFEESKKTEAYFMLLATQPKQELVHAINEISYPNEEFIITNKTVYCYYHNGLGKAKLSNNFFENKLKTAITTRNYRTLTKLLELAK